jgi:hypothetical protein
VEEVPGTSAATCPNGHPLAVGQLVCDVCAGEAQRRRATARALLVLDEPRRRAATVTRRTLQLQTVLIAAALAILATSSVLLAVRTRPARHTVTGSGVSIPEFPPVLVPSTPSTLTTVRPTEAFGCPQESYASLPAELAVTCLYLAWRTADQRGTQFYASVPAVETLFSHPWQPPDRSFQGCQATSATTATTAAGLQRQTCRYQGLAMRVECSAGHGCSVVAVTFTTS